MDNRGHSFLELKPVFNSSIECRPHSLSDLPISTLHKRRQNSFHSGEKLNNYTTSKSIVKCRQRYRKRKEFRKIIESTCLTNIDDGRPFAKIRIFDDVLLCLLDSGANVSVLEKGSLDFIYRNNIRLENFKSGILTANGSKNDVVGYCNLPVTFKEVTKFITFYVVPNLSQQGYLGIDFWKMYGIAPQIFPEISCSELVKDADVHFHNLTPEQKIRLDNVILKFPSYEKLGLGCTNLLRHHIDTGDSAPVKQKHYPLSPPRQEEVYEELDRLLALGVIEESNSPWCSPIVTIRKPGKI